MIIIFRTDLHKWFTTNYQSTETSVLLVHCTHPDCDRYVSFLYANDLYSVDFYCAF